MTKDIPRLGLDDIRQILDAMLTSPMTGQVQWTKDIDFFQIKLQKTIGTAAKYTSIGLIKSIDGIRLACSPNPKEFIKSVISDAIAEVNTKADRVTLLP